MQIFAVALAANGTARGAAGWMGLLPLILIFIVFWFILIFPQQRRQKQHKKMLESLEKGDKIVTIGGIYGTVTQIGERTVIIKVDENTKLEIAKNAIASIEEKRKKD